jgi:uncharacterized membrane protein
MTNQETKQGAQERVRQIQAFRQELDELVREGVIDEASLGEVRHYHDDLLAGFKQHYDVDLDLRGRQLSMGMRTASLLGALALAASVFFFFYQVWGYLATTGQIILLAGGTLVTLGATFFIQRRDKSGHFTNLMAFISLACFVLNISMMGQIFNMASSENALLLWAAFGMVLAYSFSLRLLLAVSILYLYGFIAARIGTWAGLYWLSFGSRPENFLAPSIILFLVPWLVNQERRAGFAPLYRILALCGFFLTILVMANSGEASYLSLDPNFIEGIYQVLGLVASAGAIWLGVKMDWRETVNTGTVFFVLFLYTKFFDWWWDWMPKFLFFLIVGATAFLALLVFRRLRLPGGDHE